MKNEKRTNQHRKKNEDKNYLKIAREWSVYNNQTGKFMRTPLT